MPRLSPPHEWSLRGARQRLTSAVAERLPLKGTALLLALILWLVVNAEEPAEDWVPVRLSLLTDTAVALRDGAPQVRALVVGRGRELLKLIASPPTIRRTIPGDSPETMVLELRPGDVLIPTGVDADVRDVQPRSLTLHLDASAERRVPVRSALRLIPDSGVTAINGFTLEPESVLVSGRRSAVRAVDSVVTTGGAIRIADTLPVLVDLDTGGLGVRINPARVRLRVRVVPDTSEVPSGDAAGVARENPRRSGRATPPRRAAP